MADEKSNSQRRACPLKLLVVSTATNTEIPCSAAVLNITFGEEDGF
jgi:hypothetical protein